MKKLEAYELESIGDLLDLESFPFIVKSHLSLRRTFTEGRIENSFGAIVASGISKRDNHIVCKALNSLPKLMDHIAFLDHEIEQLRNRIDINQRRSLMTGATTEEGP